MLKRKNKIENNKGSKSQLIIVGSLLIILGTLIIGGKYLYNYLETKNEEQLIDTFFEEQKEIAEASVLEYTVDRILEEQRRMAGVRSGILSANAAEPILRWACTPPQERWRRS